MAEISIGGRRLETAEWPGADPALVLLHEGLGIGRAARAGSPRRSAAATGRRVIAFSRFGHGHSERPPKAPHAGLLPRGGARGAARGARASWVRPRAGADRPQRRRARSRSSTPAMTRRPGIATRAPHVIVEDVTVGGDPGCAGGVRLRRAARADGAPPRRRGGRLQRLVRRLARSGVRELEPRGRRRAGGPAARC